MRKGCQPCLVDDSGQPVALQRVDFTDPSLSEDFLQKLVHATPHVLPVDELDAFYGPLVTLGREISNIDNLFVSPSGRLTIVETKLWSNPEATRQVVAQILDYAVRVSSWDYSELEKQAREPSLPRPSATPPYTNTCPRRRPQDVLPSRNSSTSYTRACLLAGSCC